MSGYWREGVLDQSKDSIPGAAVVPRQPKRLLIIVNDEMSFLARRLEIARQAAQSGFEVHVALPSREIAADGVDPAVETVPQTLEDAVAAGLFTFHPIRMTRGKTGLLDELRIVFEVRRVIRSVNPDIVHQFAMKLALFGTVAARTVRPMPYVINSFVGLGYLFAREDVIGRVVRRCYLGVYGTAARHRRVVSVFQNADNADTVRRGAGIARGAIRVTQGGSGVDLEKFASSPLPSGEPVVVLAARMLWDKGIAEFVEAAKLIKARGVSARLALVGALDAANPAAISRAQIEEWVRTGYVEWWGLRRDMEQVFASATVACLPSYAEGVPRSLLEAAACGRPIVTTDVSGCRDVVRHGESGLLVPARDAEALAGAITAIISDHAMAKRMGESARRIAESDFSIASVSQRTIELYRDLIGP